MTKAVSDRVAWVDYAKGICIVLVVLMHSTLGVEKQVGEVSWLHGFIDWARPFRMPDFFLISGLFLASRIGRPWRDYADSKVLHFAYFYVLWMTIQSLTKAYPLYLSDGLGGVVSAYLMGFIDPYGTLWFIYMLAVFFVVVKLTRQVPPVVMFAAGALLEILPIETGWSLIDEFAARFVYFYVGYWLAARVFRFASGVNSLAAPAIFAGLLLWGFGNFWMVHHGYAALPGVSLALGFIGAAAVISAGVLLSKLRLAQPLRYAGENSIVIYLAFFLFMAFTRSLLLRFGVISDLGVVALCTTAAGVLGPVLLFWATRHGAFSFLFRRPRWARLASPGEQWHSAPHGTPSAFESRRPSLSG
jgi:uncharacterized membrane protein YcfT